MAIKTQSGTGTYEKVGRNDDFELLQAILISQGQEISYDEAASIGSELLGFFEALAEVNDLEEQNDA